jgi:hypothetical protein
MISFVRVEVISKEIEVRDRDPVVTGNITSEAVENVM